MRKHQQGGSLIFVLIILVAMLISSVAVIRSAETTTAVAGNIAFKEAATQAGDLGLGAAELKLASLASPDSTVQFNYYAQELSTDGYGVPTGIDWSQVPKQVSGNYTYQYILERLCFGALPVTDINLQCRTAKPEQQGSSKLGSPLYAALPPVYFRATVRVTGPKNAESFVQGIYYK